MFKRGERAGDDAMRSFLDTLINHATGEVKADRVDEDRWRLLSLVSLVLGKEHCAALLWQIDDGVDGPELRLAYAYDEADENNKRPLDLCDIDMPMPDGQFPVMPPAVKQKLSQWFGRQHPNEKVDFHAVRVRYRHRGDQNPEQYEDLGFLHIIAPLDRLSNLDDTARWQLDTIAAALGARIFTGRQIRPMKAMLELQERVNSNSAPGDIFTSAAEVLRRAIGAELCMIYRLKAGDADRPLRVISWNARQGLELAEEDLDSLALPAESLTHHAFERKQAARLNDLHDAHEIQSRFPDACPNPNGRAQLDRLLGKTTSWMCEPVGVPLAGGGTAEAATALIKLLNKNKNYYLHGGFTKTDVEILKKISSYIGIIIPDAEINAAIKGISTVLSKMPFDSPERKAPIAEAFYNSLDGWVDGLSSVIIEFDDLDIIQSYSKCNNNFLISVMMRYSVVGKISEIPPMNNWCYTLKLDNVPALLRIGLEKPSLSRHQAEIILRAGREFGRLAYDMAAYEQALVQMIEIRHAIRSGIQGVLGHIDAALGELELVRAVNNPQISHRELVEAASFRKSLEAGFLSARQTQILLEEARYAYSNINHSNLQLGEHSLRAVLREMRRIVAPEFHVRDLRLEFDNKIPTSIDRMVFDRNAICILILNLLDNAAKYAFRGTAVILSAGVSREMWWVSVTDDGVYIDPKDHKAIFEPFRRIATHDPAARDGISSRPGTGLGLAVCLRIVKAHSPEASLEVKSERPDDGQIRARTTFTLTMPRRL